MKIKGKIFNSEEVQAIIAGKKTMFREVAKPPRHELLVAGCDLKGQLIPSKEVKGFQVYFEEPKNKWFAEDKPTGIIVKSKFEVGQEIFVKQGHSRLIIRIKNIKIEKLKDISDKDCKKEGAIKFKKGYPPSQFAEYWDSTHKKLEHKWEVNPWVFVYEFEIINNLN